MPDGENIGLKGKIAFFTKKAYDYYKAGNVETSADYSKKVSLVDNPEELGYDLILTEITAVNNVAITAMGRGGKDVRIQDSVLPKTIFDRKIGGRKMRNFLEVIGVKAPDITFAAGVKDSLNAMHDAKTAEDREKIVDKVMDSIFELVDCPMRSALVSVVRDSFAHPEETLKAWPQSSKMLDGIYSRCMDAGDALIAQVTDSSSKAGEKEEKEGEKKEKEGEKKEKEGEKKEKEGEKKEKEGEKKEAMSKDSAAALIDEKLDSFKSSLKAELGDVIKEQVKAVLAPGAGGAGGPEGGRSKDSALDLAVGGESVDFIFDKD
jgi:hypothetical protein